MSVDFPATHIIHCLSKITPLHQALLHPTVCQDAKNTITANEEANNNYSRCVPDGSFNASYCHCSLMLTGIPADMSGTKIPPDFRQYHRLQTDAIDPQTDLCYMCIVITYSKQQYPRPGCKGKGSKITSFVNSMEHDSFVVT